MTEFHPTEDLMTVFSKILSKVVDRARRAWTYASVRRTFKHLSGPQKFYLRENEVAIVILGRNVGFFLEHNFEYHRAMGVTHFVYVDNDSDDDSVQIAKGLPNTIVASCTADFRLHQSLMRLFS